MKYFEKKMFTSPKGHFSNFRTQTINRSKYTFSSIFLEFFYCSQTTYMMHINFQQKKFKITVHTFQLT
jgi:hypothetical protein